MHRVISSAWLVVLLVGLVGTLYGQNVSFKTAVSYPVDTFPISVAVGDFNGDGAPDLAVANQGSGKVLLGNGDGTLRRWCCLGGRPQRVQNTSLAFTGA